MQALLNKKNIDKIILGTIFLFFFIINIIYFYLHYYSLIEVESYSFNELFINYQSGFIRRGLLGEFAWQLNARFEIDPRHFFSIFFLIIYLLHFTIFFILFKRYIVSKLFFIFIFFAPSLLLFHIYSPDLYFLKDGIIKFVILLHAYIFYYSINVKKDKEKYFNYLKFLIIPLLFMVILTHEYQVFSLGVHFLISLGTLRKDKELKNLIKVYLPLLIPFFLIIIFFGNETQFLSLSDHLQKFNVNLNPHLGGGFIKYLGAFYKWHFYYFSYRDFLNLFFSLILSLFVIYFLFHYMLEKKIIFINSLSQKNYIIYFIPCILPFFLTTDHGRNFSLIAFYLISFYSTLNLNTKNLITLCNQFQKSLFNKSLLILFLFFFIFMWKLDQFAGFALQGKPNDIFQSSLFAEFLKFLKFLYNFIDINIINLPEIKL